MKSVLQALAFVGVLALVSCQSPLLKPIETNVAVKGEVGSLRLSVNDVPAAASGVAKARTLFPQNAAIASYQLTGTGPNGATFPETTAVSGSFSIPNLVVGEWTLTVSGLDSTGTAIASGSQKVTIVKDTSASATITLAPLDGKGTVELTVSWPADKVVTQVVGNLTNNLGVSTPVTFTVTGAQASATVTDLKTGYYLAVITIANNDSNVTSPRFDSVLVYANKQTQGSYALVAADFDYTAVIGVSLDKAAVSVGVGGTTTLVATLNPLKATLPAILWSSSDTSKATVDSQGVVTGVSVGTATITATTLDGRKEATSTVTVKPNVTALNKATTGMLVGGTELLVVVTNPLNAADAGVVWSTGNASVATVDQTGLVTAIATGTTLIKATAADGNTYASAVINVSATDIPVTAVTVTPTVYSLFNGQIAQLTNSTTPTDATNQNVTWASSDPSVATVDASGLVTSVKPGKAVITVTTVDGSKTATSTVYVSTSQWSLVDKSVYRYSNSDYSQSSSTFSKISTDTAGNVYAVGTANYGFDFGSGISSVFDYGSKNLVMKLGSNGSPLWAKMISTSDAAIHSSTVDGDGNTYLLGTWNSDYSSIDYTGGAVWGRGTVFLLKFGADGAVKWAQPLIRGAGVTPSALAVDASGNLYIAGSIAGTLPYQFVGGFNVVGTAAGKNALVVKTDANGLVQWAKSTTQGTYGSDFSSVAVDAQGNVYTSGVFGRDSSDYLYSSTFGFGNGISATGVGFGIVKYSSTGAVSWAVLTTSTNSFSGYYMKGTQLAVDSSGAVYAIHSNSYSNLSALKYGALPSGGVYASSSFLVKYSNAGTPEWVTAQNGVAHANPIFQNLTVNSNDQVVVVGNTTSSGSINLGFGDLVYSNNSLFHAVITSAGTAMKAEFLNGDPVKSYQSTSVAVSGDKVYVAGQRSTINNSVVNTPKAMLLQY